MKNKCLFLKFTSIMNKLQKLWWLMSLYCKKQWLSIQIEKQKLYQKYNINSRSELSEDQIDEEIKTYKAGLEYD